MDQGEAPILDAIEAFHRASPAMFTIQGHKCGAGVDDRILAVLGRETFHNDMAATKGLDDRANRKRVLEKAQSLAASLLGADRAFFSVNGSSMSVQVALLTIAGPGDKVAVARNSHRSVIGGLIISGAEPVFVQPAFDDELRIAHPVEVAEVRSALDEHSDLKGVLVVSPSYYGVAGDVAGLAALCHDRDVPLVVDAAWGAHFPFHPDL